MTIRIENSGQDIVSTDYWQSEYAKYGKVLISPNAGCIRCLLPEQLGAVLSDLRKCKYAIVSVGKWSNRRAGMYWGNPPIQNSRKCVEILWEDDSNSPHTWHVTEDSCSPVPGDPGSKEWVIACWIEHNGKPNKALELPCKWRRVNWLPCLKEWK